MLYKNWISKSRISLVILFLFSSCIEDKSIIFNPEEGESYEFIKFNLNYSNSFSFRENDFSTGSSSRLYLGRDNNEIKSYILLKLKNELFSTSAICEQENFNEINSVSLKITSITFLSKFII